ncbi:MULTISPECIES: fasciclin domain-containing protein [unclassified Marichromatium]|uniref:fasciclin domain-containing protein n=1 Tax=unclassified Marichromatium TaxID=2618417 RepID=UPI000F3EF0E1|nr:fasciclin domain-containing protein [Marichromatium sp. AB32]RNE92308.1 fasciclin domain-containing protein [Marichromatium sp. AB32]
MSNDNVTSISPLTAILVLAAAVGPLAALSIGSKVADEETLERARAGLENATPTDRFAHYDSLRSPSYASNKSITDITEGSGVFTKLQAAIEAAGAEAMFSEGGPYTVFAPSNEAFSRIPADQLEALLSDKERLNQVIAAHVVPGRLSPTELMQLESAPTLSGERVAISVPGMIKVGEATVSQSIAARNGVVHVIDRVLL